MMWLNMKVQREFRLTHLRPLQLRRDCLRLSVVVDDKDGDGMRHFEKNFEEIFEKISKFLHTSLRQNQKYAMDYSSGKKIDLGP